MAAAALVGWKGGERIGLFGASILEPMILTATLSLVGLIHHRPPAEAILAAQFFIGIGIGVFYVGVTLSRAGARRVLGHSLRSDPCPARVRLRRACHAHRSRWPGRELSRVCAGRAGRALLILTGLFGLIIALGFFLLAFFRVRGGFGSLGSTLAAAIGIAFIMFLAATLGRDFPPGLLQRFFDLPWPFT
jgi:Transition state regulatory protein AbrB